MCDGREKIREISETEIGSYMISTDNISDELNSPSWKFLFGWIVANFLGAIIGVIAQIGMAYIFSGGFGSPLAEPEPVNTRTIIFISLPFGIAPGVILSFFQLLAIRNYIKNFGIWYLATTVGFTIGIVTETSLMLLLPVDVYFSFPNFFFYWIISGLFVGIFQWITLRKILIKSGYWILANFLVGVIAGVGGLIPGMFFWGIGSLITGATLVWLISKQKLITGN